MQTFKIKGGLLEQIRLSRPDLVDFQIAPTLIGQTVIFLNMNNGVASLHKGKISDSKLNTVDILTTDGLQVLIPLTSLVCIALDFANNSTQMIASLQIMHRFKS